MKRRLDPIQIVVAGALMLALLLGLDLAMKHFADTADAQFRATHGDYAPRFQEGALAPDFTLPDNKGQMRSLASLVKGDTILCFLCGCSHCRHMQTYLTGLLKGMGDRAPAVVSVTTAPVEMEEAWRRDTGLAQTLLYEPKTDGSPVTAMYRGHPCPRVFRLDGDRRVTWIGPSPGEVNRMQDVGEAVARNLKRLDQPPRERRP
ncbi:MAG: peroxiredoxin family protein [Actinomycetota bacterium]